MELTFYHGTINRYNILKPTSFNAGHFLRQESWAVFLWHQKILAYEWGIATALSEIISDLNLDKYPVFRYERFGIDDYNMRIGVQYRDYDIIKNYLNRNPNKYKFYIYTVKISPIDRKLGMGNCDWAPEYTYDGDLKPTKVDIFDLTTEIFNDFVIGLDDYNYKDWKQNIPNMRGVLSPLYSDEAIKKWGYVKKMISQGKAEPGDDLDVVLKDYKKYRERKLKEKAKEAKEKFNEDASIKYQMYFKPSVDGSDSGIVDIDGKMYRPRVELLLIKDDRILLRLRNKPNQYGTLYNLPGGGFDNDKETIEDVAIKECCEEIRIRPKDVRFTDIVYTSEYGDNIPEWHKRAFWPVGIKYVGAITYVCIGEYGSKYNGYVKEMDRDDHIDEYKFYPINSVKDILRKEHIEALSGYVHEDLKSLYPTTTMYHGSFLKLDVLKPLAYNAGSKFRKPSWSVFMWAQWDLAYKWAIFVSVKKAIRDDRKKLGLKLPLGEHFKIGLGKYGYRIYIKYDEFDQMKALAMKYKPKFYVYTLKVPIDTKLNFGNNSMQPEYTYDGDLTVYKREEFKLTEEIFDECFEPISIKKYDELRQFNGENIRGPIGWIFKPNDVAMKEWIYVTNKVDAGEIKPGDNLEKILDDYYASLEEGTIQIVDEETIIEESWKASIKNFNQFCQQIKKPNDVMKWFKRNKVRWTKGANDNPFQWPDDLIRDKMGNCFDQTLFVHYFCKKKRLENRIFFITWQSRVSGDATGHAVPVYRQGKYVYTFIYLSKGNGVIGGPFEDFDEAQEVLNKYFQVYVNKMFKTPVYVYSSYLSEEDTARFDQYYGRRDFTQMDYMTMNHGMNIRSSHLYKINFKGFSFWNPTLPVFDLLDTAIKLLSKTGKGIKFEYENLFEETIEEEKLKADERTDFGLPDKKKYPMPDEQHVRSAIQYFNKCDPDDEAELARNIIKYMKKYKMKPVNVSKDNKFYKYYHPQNTNEEYFEEGYYKSKYEQCKYVFDSLSDEEKKYMGGHYVDSPALVYRKVAQAKDTREIVGYVELYDSGKLGMNNGDVTLSVAVHPNYRRQDLATAMIKGAIHWFKGTEYHTMSYITHVNNAASRRLAEKCGFVYIKHDSRKREIIHMITNPNRLKAIGEEIEKMVDEMSGGAGIVGMEINDVSVQTSSPGMFIIGYGERGNFVGDGGDNSGYAISNDIFTKRIYRRLNGKTVKEDFSFLDDRDITIFEYKGDPIRFYLLLKEAEEGTQDPNTDDFSYFYEMLSGEDMICEDQILYDNQFETWNMVKVLMEQGKGVVTLENEYKKLMGYENYAFPSITHEDLDLEKRIRLIKDTYRIYEDIDGYFVYDEADNTRSVSIDKETILGLVY